MTRSHSDASFHDKAPRHESAATLRFYEELNDFLPPSKRKRAYRRRLFLSPPVKDVIEAEGVPHTEVDLILVNGRSVGFEHRLHDGDYVSVYPVFEALDISPVARLRPQPLRRTRFVLDVQLGRLARRLRLLGFDTLYRNDYTDPDIVAIAARGHRILLTRDIDVLKRAAVTHGYWLRSTERDAQTREVLARFDLWRQVRPFTRCTDCNGRVVSVDAPTVKGLVPDAVLARYRRLYQCHICRKVYWEGSHYERLPRWIESWRPFVSSYQTFRKTLT